MGSWIFKKYFDRLLVFKKTLGAGFAAGLLLFGGVVFVVAEY